jgi:ATP adenylyltransferase/5',5'''-P-1,P-4-tetraphosphate phosphorylase II
MPLPGKALPLQIEQLFRQQMQHWHLLQTNVRDCSLAQKKTIKLGQFDIYAQHNSKRILSTAANVDQQSLRQRPCKLCVENLFPEQKALPYGEELIILCNPYPILDRHLSIVDRKHVPQSLQGRLGLLLELAKDLSNRYVTFYNGPQCGASAPDHFHVQACARQELPLTRHLAWVEHSPDGRKFRLDIRSSRSLSRFSLKHYYAHLVVFRSAEHELLITSIEHTLKRFATLAHAADEPLINLLVMYDEPVWTVCLFPRSAHRPACYHDGSLTISPASLDMAGCLVVPIAEHFAAIDATKAAEIFAEVTLQPRLFAQLIEQ